MQLPIVTVKTEGGYYSPDHDASAPIRIYKDRRVQDDFVTARLGRKYRGRLTRKEYRHAKKAAHANRQRGDV